jgi:hypothetical protein
MKDYSYHLAYAFAPVFLFLTYQLGSLVPDLYYLGMGILLTVPAVLSLGQVTNSARWRLFWQVNFLAVLIAPALFDLSPLISMPVGHFESRSDAAVSRLIDTIKIVPLSILVAFLVHIISRKNSTSQ